MPDALFLEQNSQNSVKDLYRADPAFSAECRPVPLGSGPSHAPDADPLLGAKKRWKRYGSKTRLGAHGGHQSQIAAGRGVQ